MIELLQCGPIDRSGVWVGVGWCWLVCVYAGVLNERLAGGLVGSWLGGGGALGSRLLLRF
jgi:hypothetical protein